MYFNVYLRVLNLSFLILFLASCLGGGGGSSDDAATLSFPSPLMMASCTATLLKSPQGEEAADCNIATNYIEYYLVKKSDLMSTCEDVGTSLSQLILPSYEYSVRVDNRFIDYDAFPFMETKVATNLWRNEQGLVVSTIDDGEYLLFSRFTGMSYPGILSLTDYYQCTDFSASTDQMLVELSDDDALDFSYASLTTAPDVSVGCTELDDAGDNVCNLDYDEGETRLYLYDDLSCSTIESDIESTYRIRGRARFASENSDLVECSFVRNSKGIDFCNYGYSSTFYNYETYTGVVSSVPSGNYAVVSVLAPSSFTKKKKKKILENSYQINFEGDEIVHCRDVVLSPAKNSPEGSTLNLNSGDLLSLQYASLDSLYPSVSMSCNSGVTDTCSSENLNGVAAVTLLAKDDTCENLTLRTQLNTLSNHDSTLGLFGNATVSCVSEKNYKGTSEDICSIEVSGPSSADLAKGPAVYLPDGNYALLGAFDFQGDAEVARGLNYGDVVFCREITLPIPGKTLGVDFALNDSDIVEVDWSQVYMPQIEFSCSNGANGTEACNYESLNNVEPYVYVLFGASCQSFDDDEYLNDKVFASSISEEERKNKLLPPSESAVACLDNTVDTCQASINPATALYSNGLASNISHVYPGGKYSVVISFSELNNLTGNPLVYCKDFKNWSASTESVSLGNSNLINFDVNKSLAR